MQENRSAAYAYTRMGKHNALAPKPRISFESAVIFVLASVAAAVLLQWLHLSLWWTILIVVLAEFYLPWPSAPGSKCRVQHLRNEGPHECSKFPAGPALPPLPWRHHCGWWVDASGRKIIPRGVNFSGNCKLPARPAECSQTHLQAGSIQYTCHREVSFVGRPCPLEDCREHFSRMRTCGCSLVRLLVNWEALEHAGPLQYDEEYIAYIRSVCEIAQDVGVYVWIDPHMDCWSRYTGGSGAPGWTLEVCGMKVSRELHTSRAADLHWEHEDPAKLPHLSWVKNSQRLACCTMYTVFFAGDTYCPSVEPYWDERHPAPAELAGLSLQRVLQECYLRCYSNLASKLAGLKNVLGIETMNEPEMGFMCNRDLSQHTKFPFELPETPFDVMVLADKQAWYCGCLWRRAGVWDYVDGRPELKKKHYFSHPAPVAEFFVPFVREFAASIRKAMSHAEVVVNAPAFGPESEEVFPRSALADMREYSVVSVHKYDEILLDRKVFVPGFSADTTNVFSAAHRSIWSNIVTPAVLPIFGAQGVIDGLHRMMWVKRAIVDGAFGPRIPSSTWAVPAVVSETGISMDVRGLHGFATPEVQTKAMDPTMRCLDAGFWPFTIWNYSLENSNEWGDYWNLENLSVYSPEGSSGIDWKERPWVSEPEWTFKHLRAVAAWVRPHVVLLAGDPVHQEFIMASRTYTLVWHRDETYQGEEAVAVIFLPLLHYGSGFKVEGSSGLDYKWYPAEQTLKVREYKPSTESAQQIQAELKMIITAIQEAAKPDELELPLVSSQGSNGPSTGRSRGQVAPLFV